MTEKDPKKGASPSSSWPDFSTTSPGEAQNRSADGDRSRAGEPGTDLDSGRISRRRLLGVIGVLGLGAGLGGRVFAVWATAVWIVLPYAGRMYALPSLRHDYTHVFLPHLLGLADDPRFPAMVAFLAAMCFTLRAIETGVTVDVAIAVAAAGVGAALVPREALVALAPLAALALSGERRQTALGAAAALAIVLAGVGAAVAAGLLSQPFAHVRFREPVDALASLKENFWSGRVIEWLAIAGVLGVFRARSSAGAMIGVALLAAFLSWRIRLTPIETNLSLLRTLLPVWPAVTLAVASLPLLVPRRRPGARSM